MWISPSWQDTDFEQPLSIEDKITIFEDRTIGWKLDIADQAINGSEDKTPIPHSGYAAMDIVFSYFEMISKYEKGYAQIGQSEKHFKLGVYAVFPWMKQHQVQTNIPGVVGQVKSLTDYVLDLLYKGVRCGLYHSGITNGRIVITSGIYEPMALDLQNMVLIINPHLLVPAIMAHFNTFISRIRDPNNRELRKNFETRFDFDTTV